MRSLIIPVTLIFFLIACNQGDKKESSGNSEVSENKPAIDPTLLTDSTWGLITASTDFDGLKKIFGEANVKDRRICGAECVDSVDITLVFPDMPGELIIYWTDSGYHKNISIIRSWIPGMPYHTASGIRMGSTLNDLLKVNKAKIGFAGFGWDYGGYIQSYNGGAFENSTIHFRLDLLETTGNNDLYGDTELNTDMPAVKKVLDKITVGEISLSFNR